MSTQHAPPPLPLPRDDPPTSLSTSTSSPTRSPTYSRDSDDAKPIALNQSKASPPAPPKSQTVTDSHSSRSSSPQPPSQSTPEDDEDELDEEDVESSESEIVDMEVFSQLIELDEDDPDFSKEMVYEYFTQANTTFEKLDKALSEDDLSELSSLGHYLKGSSAALGLSKVQKSCEKIQHYGQLRNEEKDDNDGYLNSEQALALITKTLTRVKKEYIEAEKWLKNYYDTRDV